MGIVVDLIEKEPIFNNYGHCSLNKSSLRNKKLNFEYDIYVAKT